MGKQVKLYHNPSMPVQLPYMVEVDSRIVAAFEDRVDAEKLIHELRMRLCREKAAQVWCHPRCQGKVLDPDIAVTIAELLMEVGY